MTGKTVTRARQLRKTMTPPEVTLWQHLRMLRAYGWHFRRQAPEPPYILDFVCRRARLVVEVDGDHHGHAEQAAHDARRDAVLRERSLRVMRSSALDVQTNLDGVMRAIRTEIGARDILERTREESPAPSKAGARYRSLVRLGLRRRRLAACTWPSFG